MLRHCPRCGNNFDGVKEQRLCPQCRAAAQQEPRIISHKCKTCGTDFEGGPRAMYCPACRLERRKAADAKSKAARRAGTARHIGSTDICKRCGKPYTVASGLQQYCPTCGPIVLAEKMAPVKRAQASKYRADNPTDKKDRQKDGTVCVVCGKLFTATKSTNTCSDECAKKLKQIRQRGNDAKRRHK